MRRDSKEGYFKMTMEDVQKQLNLHKDMLTTNYGVKTLSVFGSVVRGEATSNSDVDVLVEFTGVADYVTFVNLKERLEEVLGASVDLVTRKALRPELKSAIEAEAVRVA